MDRRNRRITTRASRRVGVVAAALVLFIGTTEVCGGAGIGSEGKLYWTDVYPTRPVWRADLDGSNVEPVISQPFDGIAVALDPAEEKMYVNGYLWLYRSDLNGVGLKHLVLAGSNSELALDLVNRKMYFSTGYQPAIFRRADLDGRNVENLLHESGVLIGIAVDPHAGKVYWTAPTSMNPTKDRIKRANLDATNVEVLVSTESDPYGLVLDTGGGKMYWTDIATRRINRANLDGTDMETLFSVIGTPLSIELDLEEGKVYWSESNPPKIQRADLSGTSSIELLLTEDDGLVHPYGIALLPPPPCSLADVNRDGTANDADVPPFIGVLLNGPANEDEACAADSNADGQVDGLDIPGFVSSLLGSGNG